MTSGFGSVAGWAVAAALAVAPPAQASGAETAWEALRTADNQLAAIGFRLSTAAAPLCDRLEPGTGIQFHSLAQYAPASRAQVRAHFHLDGALGVEGVAPGSPAERAGVRADDTVVAINGQLIPTVVSPEATTAQLAAFHARIAALPPAAPILFTLRRAGKELSVRVEPVAACLSRYELRIADKYDARANGELVQISSKYLEDVPQGLLPAVIAHELSHNVLRHRERLSAAGAQFGMASGFGRNVGLFRQTEIEADILAVHLLARAGYDPAIAARFWREVGPKLLAGLVRSRSHPPISDRVAIATAEAARIGGSKTEPPPSFLAERTQPLSGNWQHYLPAKSSAR